MHFFLGCLLSSDCIWTPFAIAFADDSSQRLTCCQGASFVEVQGIARTFSKDPPSHLSPSPVSSQGIGIFPPKEPFLYLEERAIQEAQFEDCRGRGEAAHSCSHSSSESLRAAS